jgi:N-acetylmuramoyl-L-alanine amidase
MIEKLLTENEFSRPGMKLKEMKGVVLHWTGVRNQTALQAWEYFESLKNQKPKEGEEGQYASAHYIVDEDGPILCVPENEVAYHSGSLSYKEDVKNLGIPPWYFAIGIEMCFKKGSGEPEELTKGYTIQLVQDICLRYDLMPIYHLWRHYDMTGKPCPLFYVKNQQEWEFLKQQVYDSVVLQQRFLKKRRSKCKAITDFVRGLFG